MAIKDLLDYASLNFPFEEQLLCQMMRDLLKALNTMHSYCIWHRNISIENILVMSEEINGPQLAISGFGTSIFAKTPTYVGPAVGSLMYAAPELLEVSDGKLHFKDNVECLF